MLTATLKGQLPVEDGAYTRGRESGSANYLLPPLFLGIRYPWALLVEGFLSPVSSTAYFCFSEGLAIVSPPHRPIERGNITNKALYSTVLQSGSVQNVRRQ